MMSIEFNFTWDPDREESIRPSGQTSQRLSRWCRLAASGQLSGSDATIDLNDFCDDMEFYIEGLRHLVAKGYTPDVARTIEHETLEVFEESGVINGDGVTRLAFLREGADKTRLSTAEKRIVAAARVRAESHAQSLRTNQETENS